MLKLAVLGLIYIIVVMGVAASTDEEPLRDPDLPRWLPAVFWPIALVCAVALIIRRANYRLE